MTDVSSVEDGRAHAESGDPALRPETPRGGHGVVFVGDVHGHYAALARLAAALPRTLTVVQVGDLGPLAAWAPMDRPLHFLRGNHDDVPALRGVTAPAEVRPGLVYLLAGVHLLGGMRVGVLGGAESVDGPGRVRNVDWWPGEEGVQPREQERLLTAARDTRGVDLLVTHTPPASVVEAMLHTTVGGRASEDVPSPSGVARGADLHASHSRSAVAVEQAWRVLGQPPLVCGHMHRPWRDGVVEVLGPFGVALRALWQGQVRRSGGIR